MDSTITLQFNHPILDQCPGVVYGNDGIAYNVIQANYRPKVTVPLGVAGPLIASGMWAADWAV